MTTVTVDIPSEYINKINILKAERNIGSKAKMIEEIVKEYINRIEIDKIKE